MRLVVWNCRHDGLAQKIDRLAALAPDVAIVPEVYRTTLDALPAGISSIWAGRDENLGLAVLGFNEWRVEQSAPLLENWYLPFVATEGGRALHAVGVWTETSKARPYQEISLAAARRLQECGLPRPAVVAGDFNLSDRVKGAELGPVLKILDECGYRSAWHTRTGDTFGEEAASTYFHQFSQKAGFHIDYVFCSGPLMGSIEKLSVGNFAEWIGKGLSDHAPIILDFNTD